MEVGSTALGQRGADLHALGLRQAGEPLQGGRGRAVLPGAGRGEDQGSGSVVQVAYAPVAEHGHVQYGPHNGRVVGRAEYAHDFSRAVPDGHRVVVDILPLAEGVGRRGRDDVPPRQGLLEEILPRYVQALVVPAAQLHQLQPAVGGGEAHTDEGVALVDLRHQTGELLRPGDVLLGHAHRHAPQGLQVALHLLDQGGPVLLGGVVQVLQILPRVLPAHMDQEQNTARHEAQAQQNSGAGSPAPISLLLYHFRITPQVRVEHCPHYPISFS